MSITTKRGDKGFTDLLFGGKVSKDDPQIEALGAIDELNAALGLARVVMVGEVAEVLDRIQKFVDLQRVLLLGLLSLTGRIDATFTPDHNGLPTLKR